MSRAAAILIPVAVVLAGCGGGSPAARHQHTATSPRASSRHRAAVASPARRGRPILLPDAPTVRGPHHERVPILMYHVVTAAPAGTPFPELWTPAPVFAQTMALLKRAGYHGVSLAAVWRYWRKGVALPGKPVVISFDDGYLSQYTHAMPVLYRLRWPGVLNMKVGNLGKGGLTHHMISAMIARGWELDAHTITHPDLTTVDAARLHREVAGSRATLRRLFHVPVDFFCYPSGRYNATVEAEVKRDGYLAATTVDLGLAGPSGDRFALPRVRVDGSEAPATVLQDLSALAAGRTVAAAPAGAG